MSLIWIIIEGHAENTIPRKTKAFALFHVSSMNLHTSALNGLGTTILSDLNDMLFSTASSEIPIFSESHPFKTYITTLDVSSVF